MSITYNIEHHEISALTAPMWDACGIECPAMIGATCPANRLPVAVCPGWSGKFPNAAAEVVYGWTLESFQDEVCGGGDDTWFGLFTADETDPVDGPMGAGVILVVLTSGAVHLTRFDTAEELTRDWAKIVAETEEDEEEL